MNLANVDNDISSFKSANLLPDVQAAANMYMNQANEAKTSLETLKNQAYMVRYIRNYLYTAANKFQLLPANSGIGGAGIESQIDEYNKKNCWTAIVWCRKAVPRIRFVVQMDASLAGMRKALINSIDNQLVSLNEQIKKPAGVWRSGHLQNSIQSSAG